MATFRNAVNRSPTQSAQAQLRSPTASEQRAAEPQGARSNTSVEPESGTSSAQPADSTTSNPSPARGTQPAPGSPAAAAGNTTHSPVFFQLPFAGPDGTPALLAFHPQPLPRREGDSQHDQSQTSPGQPSSSPSSTTAVPPTNPAHSVPHPDGHVPVSPLFVPFGASPLPFSFIYDSNTQTAWPIAQVTPGTPPGGPSPDAPDSQQPRLVAGPPFRIILDIQFASPPAPEQPDAEKAAKYVKQLERADAELRARMARLGIGSIGGFADSATSDEQDALLGCGICLDSYEAEDRPEWIDGPKSQDEAVVAVPCPGHHTLHAGCLREWLAKLPPSQWTCPFCRASLSVNSKANTASASPSKSPTSSVQTHPTLRDEVRTRERTRGWRCDAPACLPRYPISSRADDGHLELPETSEDMTTDLVKLVPCHHEVHLDCLCTSMRVENDLTGTNEFDAFLSSDDDEASDDAELAIDGDDQPAQVDINTSQRSTVGKWVNCPACRKECWAELPLRRKPQRSKVELNINTAPASEALTEPDTKSVAVQDSSHDEASVDDLLSSR